MTPRRSRWQIGGEDEEVRVSRSQKKRDSAALQATGETLARMPAARRALLPLPPELKDSLEEYDRLSAFEARRRQLQYIGRLMREAREEGTLQPLLDALARLE
ncbi:ribosome biogenesis factor YjgA [uncultured Mailhella sp.]|uniref:ribosome biogenesis factor YjgA n=1 Tax=uncultured Mailhella sp. TaxID=1981031 RepID=UPI00260E9521|nr:ribosome biogenesis factor YjgA [uncultured Mailhella sp.]